MNKVKLSQIEEAEIKKYPPLTRAITYTALDKEYAIDELFKFIEGLKRAERPLRRELKERVNKLLSKKDFEGIKTVFFHKDTNLYDFYNLLKEDPESSKNIYIKEFLTLIYDYCFFIEYAKSVVLEKDFFDLVLTKLKYLKAKWTSYDYNRSYCIHTIKILNFKMENKEQFSSRLFSIALDPSFSSDPEIYLAQSALVRMSYDAIEDKQKYEKVKKICYDFIAASFSFELGTTGPLVDYLFAGDWISEKTLRLLISNKDKIRKGGFDKLILGHVKKLYNQIYSEDVSEKEFTDSDKRVMTLFKEFSD